MTRLSTALGIVTVTATWVALLSATPAVADVRGAVVHGDSGRRESGIRVALVVTDRTGKVLDRVVTVTDRRGDFRFDLPRRRAARYFSVETRYRGGLFGGRLESSRRRDSIVEISVWDTTTDPTAVEISRMRLYLVPKDETLEVLEVVTALNRTERAYVGRGGGDATRGPSFVFALPPGAMERTVRLVDSDAARFVPTVDGLGALTAIPPGATTTRFRYVVESDGDSFDLSRTALYSVDEVVVFSPPSLRFTGLGAHGRSAAVVAGRRFTRWIVEPARAGDALTLTFSPEREMSDGDVRSLGLLAAVIAITAILLLLRRSRLSGDPALSDEDLVAKVARLDVEYANGILPRRDWQKRRERLKTDLVEARRSRQGTPKQAPPK